MLGADVGLPISSYCYVIIAKERKHSQLYDSEPGSHCDVVLSTISTVEQASLWLSAPDPRRSEDTLCGEQIVAGVMTSFCKPLTPTSWLKLLIFLLKFAQLEYLKSLVRLSGVRNAGDLLGLPFVYFWKLICKLEVCAWSVPSVSILWRFGGQLNHTLKLPNTQVGPLLASKESRIYVWK